jgi:hypothetical protein
MIYRGVERVDEQPAGGLEGQETRKLGSLEAGKPEAS